MTDEKKRQPSSREEIQRALTGGVPLGRWKEGLLFEGIAPTPGLKSSANWFPPHRDRPTGRDAHHLHGHLADDPPGPDEYVRVRAAGQR